MTEKCPVFPSCVFHLSPGLVIVWLQSELGKLDEFSPVTASQASLHSYLLDRAASYPVLQYCQVMLELPEEGAAYSRQWWDLPFYQ